MKTKQCVLCLGTFDINELKIIGTHPNQIWVCQDCSDEYYHLFPNDKTFSQCENCDE